VPLSPMHDDIVNANHLHCNVLQHAGNSTWLLVGALEAFAKGNALHSLQHRSPPTLITCCLHAALCACRAVVTRVLRCRRVSPLWPTTA